jgi:hypothetical protein
MEKLAMVGVFSEEQAAKDAENFERIKEAVALKAKEGDVQAAGVFAALVEAQTRRAEFIAKDGVNGKTAAVVAEPDKSATPWLDKVRMEADPGPYKQGEAVAQN